MNERGGFAAGPLGLSVEVHVNFDKNLTMLVEKFWNASTGRLNRVNAAIDASNFYFNMLEIFQMYFTFPSFKNIATQRSFNEIIHFPLHCLKSTFSFQKSCRKSEKMILVRSFQFLFFPFRYLAVSQKKKWFLGDFFNFQQIFQSPFFPFRNPAESPKKWFWGDFFTFQQISQSPFFPFRNPTENLKRWFSTKFLQYWTFTRFLW